MSTSTRRARAASGLATGYTMVELVVVLVLVGVLAAVAVPKMAVGLSIRDDAWRDGLLSAMRYAQKTAVSHRRMVCASVSNTQVVLTIASGNPATSCDTNLTGPNGNAAGSAFAASDNTAMTTVVSPSGVIYFQSDGRATTDGAGATTASRTLTPSGLTAISVIGETGHAE